ncbi:MAG: hypothetical protein AAF846_17110 [Chloroflexota bacterium]
MTDKVKRKGTPRRRFGIRWLLLTLIIVSGGIVSYYLLQSEPEWIVYFQHDESGQQQLWLADIHHPEQARQITEQHIGTNMVSVGENHIYYTTIHGNPYMRHWLYDIRTHTRRELSLCGDGTCRGMTPSPDGKWLSYYQLNLSDNLARVNTVDFVLFDVNTGEETIVASTLSLSMRATSSQNLIQWLDNDYIVFAYNYAWGGANRRMTHASYHLNTLQLDETFATTWGYNSRPFVTEDRMGYLRYEHIVEDRTITSAEINLYTTSIHSRITNYALPMLTASDRPRYSVYDWNPETQTLIFTGSDWTTSRTFENMTISILDLTTSEQEILFEDTSRLISSAQFNHDGTQILLASLSANQEYFMSLIDLETGEERILPIAGTHPQWVD